MRILLTNDDGIRSPGILLLAKALRDAGHRIFVIAPDSERSGFSHSISFLHTPCKITEIEKDTWSCSGTPADCVIIALMGGIPELCIADSADAGNQWFTGGGSPPGTPAEAANFQFASRGSPPGTPAEAANPRFASRGSPPGPSAEAANPRFASRGSPPGPSAEAANLQFASRGSPPDMLLSGINRGANIGTDIIYSGTAAAARQGSLFGIPSAALSLIEADSGVWHWDAAVAFAAGRLEEMLSYWKAGAFLNVNFPNTGGGPSALVPAFPSLRCYNDRIEVYRAPDGGAWCFARTGKTQTRPEPGSDWEAVSNNQAAMSRVLNAPMEEQAEWR